MLSSNQIIDKPILVPVLLSRFEGKSAILKVLSDNINQEIFWPIKFLPDQAGVGSLLEANFKLNNHKPVASNLKKVGQKEIDITQAYKILEEILN